MNEKILSLAFSGVKLARHLLLVTLIKSQILIPLSVAAATHYNLGLIAIWLMVDPALNSREFEVKS